MSNLLKRCKQLGWVAPFLYLGMLLSGCQAAGHYWQVATGHMALMHKRELITDVLKKQTISATERHKFAVISNARKFAHTHFKLDVAKHFTTYIETHDEAVLWSVYAAPKLSVYPVQWCSWWVGCSTFRDFFDKDDARDFQRDMFEEGYDTSMVGAEAYSTMGVLSDSVLSSFLKMKDIDLVSLIFHELSHATVFIKGDTTLNESFAMVVEELGLTRWLDQFGRSDLMEKYKAKQAQRDQVVSLILQAKQELKKLYSSEFSYEEKLSQKQAIFETLKANYWQLRKTVSYASFDHWMKQPLNNAMLVTIATYHDWVPALKQLFDNVGGDFSAFYQAVRNLGKLTLEERQIVLKSL